MSILDGAILERAKEPTAVELQLEAEAWGFKTWAEYSAWVTRAYDEADPERRDGVSGEETVAEAGVHGTMLRHFWSYKQDLERYIHFKDAMVEHPDVARAWEAYKHAKLVLTLMVNRIESP